MTISTATEMIRLPSAPGGLSGQWADLGCGAGTFTLALAGLLAPGSHITAVDKDPGVLKQLPAQLGGVTISTEAADLAGYVKKGQHLDGVLMANALHFLPDHQSFLLSLKKSLRPDAVFVLVEYDITKASRWVPHPLPIVSATALLDRCGFAGFTLLQRRASRYGPQFLYSAFCRA